ncbi:unnamed protein product [Mycena citricolor]|uniref:Uncharacterized protein n=1 Tax=Mycena citricolor TaxID=2018698 RepID=A0AAD2K0H1_9AGAR|nr:unnamed protein product [Mycena citricolor]
MSWVEERDGSFQRDFGDSEYALFPTSRIAIGDMYLHLIVNAPTRYFRPERVRIAWSLIRRRHPLLMCSVIADESLPESPRFRFVPPQTTEDALEEAMRAIRHSEETREELFSAYMDGPRILSDERLSFLVISSQGPQDVHSSEYGIFMCAPHFLGDGTALHLTTHELVSLLTSGKADAELMEELSEPRNWMDALPPSLESRLRPPASAFGKAACKINYFQSLSREIGGHRLPRVQRAPKRTLFQEHEFSSDKTASILARCKANGVTVNHALVALCNVAWARCTSQTAELPILFYTAANLRPYLAPHTSQSCWFLALAYFTMTFPAFVPSHAKGVWLRAKSAKNQMQAAVRSPLLPTRALLSAAARSRRSSPSSNFSPPPENAALPGRPKDSAALFGISLLGDLDRLYLRKLYGPGVSLVSISTASRLKEGGFLMLGHTFCGKLALQMYWDQMGFVEGEIERFWAQLAMAVDEFLT